VFGNAWVYGTARVYGNAWLSGDAQVYGTARDVPHKQTA
jgi:YdcK Beta solenoid repeat